MWKESPVRARPQITRQSLSGRLRVFIAQIEKCSSYFRTASTKLFQNVAGTARAGRTAVTKSSGAILNRFKLTLQGQTPRIGRVRIGVYTGMQGWRGAVQRGYNKRSSFAISSRTFKSLESNPRQQLLPEIPCWRATEFMPKEIDQGQCCAVWIGLEFSVLHHSLSTVARQS